MSVRFHYVLHTILFGFFISLSATTFSQNKAPAVKQLILHKELGINPNSARVYLQYGKVISYQELDQYNGHCWFLSWKVLDTAQLIQPDTFAIVDIVYTEDYVANRHRIQIATASSELAFRTVSDGLTAVEYTTEFHIHSASQPDIRRLACNHWGDPATDRHLSAEEIQKALGNIATLKLK